MKSYAFIFARGGSKGLPGKNLKHLAGKPLLHYSIDIANQIREISKVFVSTDDPDIAAAASVKGAIVIERPENLAQDSSPEWLAWQHGVEWVEKNYGLFDQFVSLPTTSPLRAVDDVVRAMDKQMTSGSDVCISVTASNRSPFFNMVQVDADGSAKIVNQTSTGTTYRRQDAPAVYDITTVVYVVDPLFIKQRKGLFDGKVVTVEVPKERAVDIDDQFDFLFAETLISGASVNAEQ